MLVCGKKSTATDTNPKDDLNSVTYQSSLVPQLVGNRFSIFLLGLEKIIIDHGGTIDFDVMSPRGDTGGQNNSYHGFK